MICICKAVDWLYARYWQPQLAAFEAGNVESAPLAFDSAISQQGTLAQDLRLQLKRYKTLRKDILKDAAQELAHASEMDKLLRRIKHLLTGMDARDPRHLTIPSKEVLISILMEPGGLVPLHKKWAIDCPFWLPLARGS